MEMQCISAPIAMLFSWFTSLRQEGYTPQPALSALGSDRFKDMHFIYYYSIWIDSSYQINWCLSCFLMVMKQT